MVNNYMKYLSKCEEDTAAYAARIGDLLRPGDVVCLQGDLGAGKTIFARALIRSLMGDQTMDVPSPTFTLVQTYEAARAALWHFDLYRLEDPEEIYEIGWEEAIAGGISIVEWPQRLGRLAPHSCLTLVFESIENEDTKRYIAAIPGGNWKDRL